MKILFLSIFLLVVAIRCLLRWLNLGHLMARGASVPDEFASAVDGEHLKRSVAYTTARDRVGVLESAAMDLAALAFFFFGLLPVYDRWISGMTDSFLMGGWLFFSGLFLFQYGLELPFSYYRTFVLEERFCFNTTTVRLWISDQVRSFLVALSLLSLLVFGCLCLVQASPGRWWLWVWVFFLSTSIFLIYVSPFLIEPLFFKFRPVRREGLGERIRDLMARAGLEVSRVLEVDASRRSRHSNAYFTGIGRVRRIVLFDTLLEEMTDREILAVLAHEAGHWRLGHLWKRLAFMAAAALGVSLSFYFLAGGPERGSLAWLENASFPARLTLAGFMVFLGSFFLVPVNNWMSRRHENHADRFAVELTGDPAALSQGLVKLARENLTNLHPHPAYAWYYFSHPPVVQRVKHLAGLAKNRPSRKDS